MPSSFSQTQTQTKLLSGSPPFGARGGHPGTVDTGGTARVTSTLPHLAITISQSPLLRISKDLSIQLDADLLRAQKRSTSLRRLEQLNKSPIQDPRNRSTTMLQTPTPTVTQARPITTTTYLSPQDAYRITSSRSYDRERRLPPEPSCPPLTPPKRHTGSRRANPSPPRGFGPPYTSSSTYELAIPSPPIQSKRRPVSSLSMIDKPLPPPPPSTSSSMDLSKENNSLEFPRNSSSNPKHPKYNHHTPQSSSPELNKQITTLQALLAEINSSMTSELARVQLSIVETRDMIASYRASRPV